MLSINQAKASSLNIPELEGAESPESLIASASQSAARNVSPTFTSYSALMTSVQSLVHQGHVININTAKYSARFSNPKMDAVCDASRFNAETVVNISSASSAKLSTTISSSSSSSESSSDEDDFDELDWESHDEDVLQSTRESPVFYKIPESLLKEDDGEDPEGNMVDLGLATARVLPETSNVKHGVHSPLTCSPAGLEAYFDLIHQQSSIMVDIQDRYIKAKLELCRLESESPETDNLIEGVDLQVNSQEISEALLGMRQLLSNPTSSK